MKDGIGERYHTVGWECMKDSIGESDHTDTYTHTHTHMWSDAIRTLHGGNA